jgi:hypothetical protein
MARDTARLAMASIDQFDISRRELRAKREQTKYGDRL